MVSPAAKFGYQVGGNQDFGVKLGVTADGSRVTYDSTYPLPGSVAGSWSGFIGERGPRGWVTSGVPMAHGPNSTGAGSPSSVDVRMGSSARDQLATVYWDCTTAPYGALWIRRANGSRQRIADAVEFTQTCDDLPIQPWPMGISADGHRVTFSHTARLGDAASLPPGTNRILYEWVDDGLNAGAGTIRVVNRTNDAVVRLLSSDSPSLGGGTMIPRGVIPAEGFATQNMKHAMSDDGSRIFFQDPAPATVDSGGGPLYLREDGARTVEVSAPLGGYVPASPPTATGVKYLEAASDGTRAYFYADGDLVPGAPSTGGIYRFDADPDGAGPGTASLAWVDGSPSGTTTTGIADADGSHFYYQAGDAIRLATTVGVTTVGAYLVSAGTLGDVPFNATGQVRGFRNDGCASAGVSPDGRYLAFMARPPQAASDPLQVYRYDALANAGTGEVRQLSRTSAGPAARGAGFNASCGASGIGRRNEQRVMSDDGQYVFFDTDTPLVAEDNNSRFDVYRWRDGQGVGLISSGSEAGRSSFQGTDASGANAFFVSQVALVQQDGDTANDIYTARVGGGFSVERQAICSSDACQGAPGSPPVGGEPGSATNSGDGNVDDVTGVPVFSVRAINARQRATFARTGRLRLRVVASAAGRLSATASARAGRRTSVVARAGRSVGREGGNATLLLTLSRTARTQMARAGSLRLSITVKFTGSDDTVRLSLTLRKTAGSRAGRNSSTKRGR